MIILTVPHRVCIGGDHLCDYSAEPFADIFNKQLIENKFKTKVVKSNQNRIILDDNRFKNKELSIKNDSLLWKTLRNEIKTNENIIIFDIHSYPKETKNFGDNDVVILDNLPYQTITKKLNTYLLKYMTVDILTASTGHNSILDVFTLHPLYIPVVLLEINEKLNIDRLEKISTLLVNFLKVEKNNHGGYQDIKYHYLRLKSLLNSLFE